MRKYPFQFRRYSSLKKAFNMGIVENTALFSEKAEFSTVTLPHDELLEVTQSALSTLIKNDSLLEDLPEDVIVEEIQSQIAVEHGQSITIFINRDANAPLKVILPGNATVRTLKNAIKRHFEIYQRRAGIKANVSWKYIWKTYQLNYDSIVVDDNDACIQDYGITNKVTLTFKKKKHKVKQ